MDTTRACSTRLLLCCCWVFAPWYSNTALPTDILWVKYYGKEEYDAIEKCKKAAVARAKTKKTKGEFIYCVCATVLQKREYVVRIRIEEYTVYTHSLIKCKFFTIYNFLYKLFFYSCIFDTDTVLRVKLYYRYYMYIHTFFTVQL